MPAPPIPASLLDWFAEQTSDSFPPDGGSSYTLRLQQVTGILNKQVHPHVGTGAALADGGFLTDHGPDHIDTVIRRATSLLAFPPEGFPQFSRYEIFILILAIHFHDVGNIFGRAEHETKHARVMAQLQDSMGHETVERRAVLRIASAHGGRVNGNKDTISSLLPQDYVLGQLVRYRALAALLRFADELADDCHRGARYAEWLGVIPTNSEVFHAYARSLHSVVVEPANRVIKLKYSFLREDATRTFGKKLGDQETGQAYLLDEIYKRTLKMHLERVYCMRFLRDIVQIEAIDVAIEVYDEENSPTPCIEVIGYRLQEEGYPDPNFSSITDICPDICIDGVALNEQLQEGSK